MISKWQTKNIGDVCSVMTGGTPSKSKPEYFDNGDIKWLVSGDIHKGKIKNCDGRITQLGLENSNAKFLPINSVMMALNGQGKTRGTVALLRTKATCNQSLVSITPKNREQLLPEYLYTNLHGRYNEIRKITGDSGNDRRGLNMTLIKNIEIPIAPLVEQKRIVAILDEAFAGISQAVANAEKNLANARELFESYLNNVFTQKGEGWVEKKLSDVCNIISKLVDPRDSDFIDLRHIGAGNMATMSKELIDVKTAREEELKSGKFYFDKSMVLYSKIRPYLMKVSMPDFDGLCSADVYPLSPATTVLDRGFLYYLLLSRDFTDYAVAGSQRAGMPKVNRDHLFRYRAYFPGITEQKKLVTQIDQLSVEVMHLEKIYQQKLTALAELKQSLLQKAFAGELTSEPEKLEARA